MTSRVLRLNRKGIPERKTSLVFPVNPKLLPELNEGFYLFPVVLTPDSFRPRSSDSGGGGRSPRKESPLKRGTTLNNKWFLNQGLTSAPDQALDQISNAPLVDVGRQLGLLKCEFHGAKGAVLMSTPDSDTTCY